MSNNFSASIPEPLKALEDELNLYLENIDTKLSDIDESKLQKVTSSAGHSRVYAVSADGKTQKTYGVSVGPVFDRIPLYNDAGNLILHSDTSKFDGNSAVSKNYVSSAITASFLSFNLHNSKSGTVLTRDQNNDITASYGGHWSMLLGGLNKINASHSKPEQASNYSLLAGYDNSTYSHGGKDMLLGLRNISNSTCTFAGNRYNTISGLASAAFGERNLTGSSAQNSFVAGNRLVTKNPNQVAVGKLNIINDAVLSVGVGNSKRQNAFSISYDDENMLAQLNLNSLSGYEEEYTVVESAPVYNYVPNKVPEKSCTLAKICEVPCEISAVPQWVEDLYIRESGATQYIKALSKCSLITEENSSDMSDIGDSRSNPLLYSNELDAVILVIVDSISPSNMDVIEPGVYINTSFFDGIRSHVNGIDHCVLSNNQHGDVTIHSNCSLTIKNADYYGVSIYPDTINASSSYISFNAMNNYISMGTNTDFLKFSAAKGIVLPQCSYGDTVPEDPTDGQLFILLGE